MRQKYHTFDSNPRVAKAKLLLVALLYFAEGLPFGFLYVTLPVYLRFSGIDLVSIGLLSLTGLAWSLKPLWAPLLDRYGSKLQWVTMSLLILALLSLLLGQVSPAGGPYLALVFGLAFTSATLDIAVDGYTIEILEPHEVGVGNGVRVSAYRVALIVAGGALVALSQVWGFHAIFVLIAGAFITLNIVLFFWPKPLVKPVKQDSLSLVKQYLLPLKDLLGRPYIWAVVPFVLLFKVGDAMMGSMIYPFWVDKGFSRAEIGLISGTLGTMASIGGALLGGWVTDLMGLGRALWSLGATQALSNLGYAYAALPNSPRLSVYGASLIESFTGGLGTAAFLAFLMRLCRRDLSASQYALLATLFSLSRSVAGALGGWGVAHFGYAAFFFYTFVASLPAFGLIPYVLKALALWEEKRP